ncbi:IS21-like element ISGsu6 family helper ATPase IstB [Arcobacter sp. 15-2]|uniref:IS21-like element helper ATPase IstB n=1 Tax=Arcobacter sp. 15-2 TaxID=3374109 RepID=UPI00399D2B80
MKLDENIKILCTELKLSTVPEQYHTLSSTASKEEWTYAQFLNEVLQIEVNNRLVNSKKTLTKFAGFPSIKTLDEFDYNFTVGVNSKQINELASLQFIKRNENIILLGQSGVGKTHLAIALAYKAVQNRYKVKFTTTQELLANAVAAKRDKKYDNFLKSVLNPSVLIIDEIGYFNMSKEESNHFFQIISKRYEKGSTILISNLVFSKWKQVFGGDKIVTTAILDRVLHHSHIINIQGDSYRLKEKKEMGQLGLDLFKNNDNSTENIEKN